MKGLLIYSSEEEKDANKFNIYIYTADTFNNIMYT